jgi:GDPmannose 4,6-dehydratase
VNATICPPAQGSSIITNHDSPRRGFEFVSRKITSSVAQIMFGLQDQLALDNLDALRDWRVWAGIRQDHVAHAQQQSPDD